jgi:hypothetical protein
LDRDAITRTAQAQKQNSTDPDAHLNIDFKTRHCIPICHLNRLSQGPYDMIRRILALAILAAVPLLPGTSAAQDNSQSTNGYDFDTLAACSLVYQRIGELYSERGDAAQGASFQNTSYAYSSGAFYMLQYHIDDQAQAYEYSQGRMQLVMESLNQSSISSADGDMGVISEWLPYCDTLGDGVSELLRRRELEGW